MANGSVSYHMGYFKMFMDEVTENMIRKHRSESLLR